MIEETGSGQCRYRITGNVKVKMFGIGHLVEKQVMANSVDSLSMLAEVVQRCAAATTGERFGLRADICSGAGWLRCGVAEERVRSAWLAVRPSAPGGAAVCSFYVLS